MCSHRKDAPSVDTVVLMLGMSDVGMGGGDVHALRLCEALAREGSDRVRLISSPAAWPKLPPAVTPVVIEVRTPLDGRLRSMPAYLITVVLRMIGTLRRMPRAQVYVAASHFFYDVIPCALAPGACVSYVYHLIGESGRSPSLRSWVSIALERLSLRVLRRYGDLVFTDNPETEAQLLERGFRPEQIVATRNAYDPLDPLPARTDAKNGSVVFCGRISEAKGIWDIVALARTLRERVPGAHITVIGEGSVRPAVEEAVRAEALSNVSLAGWVIEGEKWRHICNATLFVAPSREEGWGIAVGEALLAGVPALVYDLPAYGHFGDLPLRVPLGDVDGFVEAAASLLAHPDRVERERARVQAGGDRLPRWHDVIEDEIAAMRSLPKVAFDDEAADTVHVSQQRH